MNLKYDIDIAYIMPEAVFNDSKKSGTLQHMGLELNSRGNYIAKFRDPATAAALNAASEQVKAYFECCGFAFIPSGNNFPDGRFDAQFDDQMTDVLKRLRDNLEKYDLPKCEDGAASWNGFNIGELMVWLGTCEPIDCLQQRQKQPFAAYLHARTKSLVLIAAAALLAYAYNTFS